MGLVGRALAASVVLLVCLANLSFREDSLYNANDEAFIQNKAVVLEHEPAETSSPFAPKNTSISLREALSPNSSTVVYLFHQRKAGGSTLRKYLLDFYTDLHTHISKARATSYVPCYIQKCTDYDPNPREQFLGQKRLLAAHLGFTTAAARAVYGEPQVLLTNFREPTSRIVSCIRYRFPELAQRVFDKPATAEGPDNKATFNVSAVAEQFLHRKDRFGDSCAGEPFRMLSPYDPDVPRTDAEIQAVCDFVQRSIHVVDFAAPPAPTNSTDKYDAAWSFIEHELAEVGVSHKVNAGKAVKASNYKANLKTFQNYIRELPVVQSEIKLYECLGLPLRKPQKLDSSADAMEVEHNPKDE